MPVARDIVHALDRRPVFPDALRRSRIHRQLAAVRVSPLAGDFLRGVRRVLQRVVGAAPFPGADLRQLGVDRDHRLAEAVELGFRFAFGRLDHQRVGDRERNGRRMETVIGEALGDVLGIHPDFSLQRAQIQYALVRDPAAGPRVEDRKAALEARGDVVGVEDREFARAPDPARPHHAQVHPRHREDQRAAERRRADRAVRQVPGVFLPARMSGQVRSQMRGHRDRPHARAAAAVRDAERLVQVDVADIGADPRGLRDSGQRVEVGAVHVDLRAGRMRDVADRAHLGFEHAVRGRIGQHQRCDATLVLPGLALEVLQVDVALRVAGHHHHPQADQRRGGRVGAVRGGRDQADIAPASPRAAW